MQPRERPSGAAPAERIVRGDYYAVTARSGDELAARRLLAVAVGTVDRAILTREKRHFCLGATGSACRGIHRAGCSVALSATLIALGLLADGAAIRTARR